MQFLISHSGDAAAAGPDISRNPRSMTNAVVGLGMLIRPPVRAGSAARTLHGVSGLKIATGLPVHDSALELSGRQLL
jgi:hypothetical protein